MPHQSSKRIVYVTHEYYTKHSKLLKLIFNENDLWLNADDPNRANHNQNDTWAIFTEKELRFFDKKGIKGWIGKEFPYNGNRIVVFPDLDDDGVDEDFDTALNQLLSVNIEGMNIKILKSRLEINDLLKWIDRQEFSLTVDFETKGLNPYAPNAKFLSIAIGNDKEAFVVPLQHQDSTFRDDVVMHKRLLRAIAQHGKMVAHNAKYEYRWFLSQGLHPTVIFDPMLVHYLLDESTSHSLDALSLKYTKYGGYKSQFDRKLQIKGDYESAPLKDLCYYNGADVIITSKISILLEQELAKNEGLKALWNDLILPLIPVIAQMEDAGFQIDEDELGRLMEWYTGETEKCERAIVGDRRLFKYFKNAGSFNFNSYPQMRVLLYEWLKFPVMHRTEPSPASPKGNPAVNHIALRSMRSNKKYKDIIDLILRRTKANTIHKMLKMYSEHLDLSSDRRLRTNFNMHVVETGRLSSTNPPLQNIPTTEALVDAKLEPVKSIFTSRFEDGNLVHVDFGQLELRTATMYTVAHGTPDKTFIAAFVDGRDLHGEMAERVYGKGYTKDQRNKAKRTNFSAVFDISPEQLALNIDVSVSEAKELIKNFRALHPELYRMFDDWWKTARKRGYIENFMHRRRRIVDELEKADMPWQIDAVKRQVWNFPIQSTAAEMTYAAMIEVQRLIDKYGMKSIIICNTHDAQDMDTPSDETEAVAKLVKHVFTHLDRKYDWITVPIKVDVAYGPNLFKMTHLE